MENRLHHAYLAELRTEIEIDGARPVQIDAIVAAMMAEGAEHPSGDLLKLLRDDVEDDSGMFTLVHAAESLDDAPYAVELLRALPELIRTSPRWAAIVLRRVLNSPNARDALVRELAEADPEAGNAVRLVARRLKEDGPPLPPGVDAVLKALS